MTAIRCPICRIEVTGDGEDALSDSLFDHVTTAHEMRGLARSHASEGPQDHHPQLWEEMKRGEVPTDQEVGEDVEETVRCPLCGDRVYGHDGSDLSDNLVVHIEDVHDLRPFRPVTTLFE